MSRPEGVRQRQREERFWETLGAKLDKALLSPTPTAKKQQAQAILRRMRQTVTKRNGGKLLKLALEYIRLTRTLPPGVYAFAPPPWKNIYLDGEALEKGLRIAKLSLGIAHPQIYR